MSIVSNYVGELSVSQFGGNNKGVTSGINLDDTTFDDLLEKQLNNTLDVNTASNIDYNPSSGIDIGDFDGRVPNYGFNQITTTNAVEKTFDKFLNPNEFSASEILTLYPSLFDSKPTLTQTASNGLFDFERKLAANSYGKYAKNIVTNLGEFVSDALR